MMERELYRQSDLPIFQNRMYETSNAARSCPKAEMLLVEDLETGLVRNAAFDPSLMDYDVAYQNEQGNSQKFQQHLNEVAELIETKMGKAGLVEVGCGKGAFLEIMLARGSDIVGFDPAYEGDNVKVRREYFSDELSIQGDGLILRHVLEHIHNPVDFMFRLAKSNGGQGLVYIEVPCFDWICDRRAWFDIFHEHVNYFRLSDFEGLFGRLIYADRGFGGQYLRVIGDLATLRLPIRDASRAVCFPSDFKHGIETNVDAKGGPCIVWGAASKGVIFSLFRERSGYPVDRVIDINPAKQGRFLPGTGLKVLSPKEGLTGVPQGSVINVMNPNYIDEIQSLVGSGFICRGVKNEQI